MIRYHEYYEIQSASAATGQLTDAELAELEQHAATCPACHECMSHMAEISRELFLMQANRIKDTRTPAGMQKRFLLRASTAGIPVTCTNAAPLYRQGIRAVAIAALLVMSISLGCRVFLAFCSKTRDVQNFSTALSSLAPTVEVANPPLAANRALHHVTLYQGQFRGRSAARHSARAIPARHFLPEDRPSSFDLKNSLFAQENLPPFPLDHPAVWSDRLASNPLAAGLLASARTSLTKATGASCFGIGEGGKPEARVCHLEIKLASLSSLGFPERIDSEPNFPAATLSARVFHLDPSRVQ